MARCPVAAIDDILFSLQVLDVFEPLFLRSSSGSVAFNVTVQQEFLGYRVLLILFTRPRYLSFLVIIVASSSLKYSRSRIIEFRILSLLVTPIIVSSSNTPFQTPAVSVHQIFECPGQSRLQHHM